MLIIICCCFVSYTCHTELNCFCGADNYCMCMYVCILRARLQPTLNPYTLRPSDNYYQAASQYYLCRCGLFLPTEQRGLSVCLLVCHTNEPCKNGCTDRAAIWVENLGGPGEPCIRWGPDPTMGRGKFFGENGRPIVKYRDTLQSSVQRRHNRQGCCLGYGLAWAVGIMCQMGVHRC